MKKSAFSLIEIALVILIIAILMAATTQGSKLIRNSKLSSAQSLTQQSIVNEISDLVAWYETSLESSFISNEASDDGKKISIWNDNNSKAINKNHATQSNGVAQPKIYFNVFNGAIPAVRFEGSSFLSFDGSSLANSAYTIFVVEKRMSTMANNYFLGGSDNTQNTNLTLGYRSSNIITQSHFNNDMDSTIDNFSSPIVRLNTFVFDSSNGKKYFENGGSAPRNYNATQTATLSSYNGAALGKSINSFYNGDLAEIIIFKRILKGDERQAVESYLSKKYAIKLND